MTRLATTAPDMVAGEPSWLRFDESHESTIRIVAIGSLHADRATDLWASVERTLEVADGRLVRLDLTDVAGFDYSTVDALREVVRAALRRHDNIEIVLRANSALDYYAQYHGLITPQVRRIAPR